MLSIAAQTEIDEPAIITHVVNGLSGTTDGKAHMYEARTIRQLKSKLASYEVQQSQRNTSESQKKPNALHCFNCGDNHPVSEYPTREKGPKCFNCNAFGHIGTSDECPQKSKPKFNIIRPTTTEEAVDDASKRGEDSDQ